ncbi:hypothetical protein ACJIZ3_020084 [Penstemon smallii]|uniref:Nuclear matrix constituent protein 1-like protein n=1 Tax=Penstemon smallii TaxID=265156 RepID=A0ABD3SHW6_9LAMI
MFTPKRPFPGLSITQEYSVKGKTVAFADGDREDADIVEDWRRFREVGLLDEAALEKRDREAVLERSQWLERELLDYQYNMGLLLIEKKEWTSKREEFQQSLLEAHAVLKREKMSHLVAVSQLEEREANLKKALDVERQSVNELERSLRVTREEIEKTKVASETKMAYASDLVAGVENRSLEVQEKLLAADSKLAEASRKTSELDRKFQEFVTRENVLKRERMSFNSERDAHEATFLEHKEHMQEMKRKLQEGEDKLFESQRRINEREEKANDFNRMLNQKQRELAKAQEKIDLENLTLKDKEENINKKLKDLIAKEEDIVLNKQQLEKQQLEMNKDIEELDALNQKLKLQRQQFIKERRHFLALVETLKSCQNCGDMAKDYVLSDLDITEQDDKEARSLQAPGDEVFKKLASEDHINKVSSASLIEERRVDSIPAGKASGKVQQKRARSRMEGSDDSEGRSESVVEGSHRKRRQTGPPTVRTAGEPRYNLRRHKAAGKAVESERKTDKEVGDATVSHDNEITYVPPGEVDNKDEDPTALVQVTSNKNVQAQTASSNSAVKTSEVNTDAVKSTENMDSSGEVNEYNNEEDEESTLHENEEDDGDEHPGESSITKKLWTFFTT